MYCYNILHMLINNIVGKFNSRKHLGIQSYIRHMTRSESLTYNIGEPRDGHKRSTSTTSIATRASSSS